MANHDLIPDVRLKFPNDSRVIITLENPEKLTIIDNPGPAILSVHAVVRRVMLISVVCTTGLVILQNFVLSPPDQDFVAGLVVLGVVVCLISGSIALSKPSTVLWQLSRSEPAYFRKRSNLYLPFKFKTDLACNGTPPTLTITPLPSSFRTSSNIATNTYWIVRLFTSEGYVDELCIDAAGRQSLYAAIAGLSEGIVRFIECDDLAEHRRWSDRCAGCNYPLSGLKQPVCPECGQAISRLHYEYLQRRKN